MALQIVLYIEISLSADASNTNCSGVVLQTLYINEISLEISRPKEEKKKLFESRS